MFASYIYDGHKKRVARTTSSGDDSKYLWNGSEIIKEYKANGDVKAQYILGAEREAIKGEDGQ